MKIRAVRSFYRYGYAIVGTGQELDLPREEALTYVNKGYCELVHGGAAPPEEKMTAEPAPRPVRKSTRRIKPSSKLSEPGDAS